MTNIHIAFKPMKNDDNRSHALSFYQCPDTGVVEVAHIADDKIEGEPFRHFSLSELLIIIADALVCNFATFERYEIEFDERPEEGQLSSVQQTSNVVPLHSQQKED